ncbi:hypothetical protein L2E82_29778 [Cichorium intybus]|uniref:Uncharacterized protein n=1 Tax=Cichorium intybus TaxID=13427 RepID=A0ACB9CYH9_CICIN|nr:hypothetical protein L2E82_29778 [Cichorium intybus]
MYTQRTTSRSVSQSCHLYFISIVPYRTDNTITPLYSTDVTTLQLSFPQVFSELHIPTLSLPLTLTLQDTIRTLLSNLSEFSFISEQVRTLIHDLKAYKPHLQVLIHVLSRHTLAKAFFHPPPSIPLSLLQEVVSSATKCDSGYAIALHNDHRVVLDKKTFAQALNLPYHTSTFDQPTDGDLKSMIYNMGYMYNLPKLFHMSKGHMSPLWQCLIHYIIKCLTGKMGGTDQLNKRLMTLLWSLYSGRKVDYTGILFDDFINYVPSSSKPTCQIHSARFWAICIEHIYQSLDLAFPDPRSADDKLVMIKAKPYTAKTDPIFGEIRRLPKALLNLADPAHPAVISHLTSTEGTSEPSSKDSESKHLEERQNSPDSEDTPDNTVMEVDQNQPPPSPPKKNSPTPTQTLHTDTLPNLTQPPPDASEFSKWKFKQAVRDQQVLVERLCDQFKYKQKELQTLFIFGPPSDKDSDYVKSERIRINALIQQLDSLLHSSLEPLVDSSFYLFDTTETDWSNIASAIIPLTWDKFCAQEIQKEQHQKQTLDQPTESDSRVLISKTQSIPISTPIFGADQELDKPSSSQMHLIDLSDTNSSSDKAAKAPQPQSVNSLLKDDSLHQKVDALTALLTDFKSSQNQEPLIKEIAELKERIAALEKKDTEILLTCDTNAEKIINDGLANLDAQRETDAANMMKTAQKMLTDVEKCQQQVPELLTNVELKLKEAMDNFAKYLNGVLAENFSLRRTNTVLLQMVTQTMQNITGTMSGPIEQIKLCTKLNMEVMEALQTMYDTPLPDCIKQEVNKVSAKIDSILARLPVTPSVPTGAPGGGKANDEAEPDQPTAMLIDSAAGPSGTKDENQNNEPENIQSPTTKSPTPKSPTLKSPTTPKSPTPKPPTPKSPPPKSPTLILSSQKSPHQKSNHSDDEILVYSPIKDSDPPEIKERKSKFFDDQANKHAKEFSIESEHDQYQADPIELGLVYKNEKEFLFLRADQLKRVTNSMLDKYIIVVERSKSSDPEAKKELLIRMKWLLEVRKF